jgi:hypothetical protein
MAMEKAIIRGGPKVVGASKDHYLETSRQEDEVFALAVTNGAVILDAAPYFFGDHQTCLLESSGKLLYNDDNHLTPAGAMLLADLFRPIFSK